MLVPEEPGLADVIAEQRELQSRLRAVVETKDAEKRFKLRCVCGVAPVADVIRAPSPQKRAFRHKSDAFASRTADRVHLGARSGA